MKAQDRIWSLYAKKLDGEATPQELKELDDLLRKHPDMTYSLDILAGLWKPPAKQETDPETEAAYVRHLQRMALQQPADKAEEPVVSTDRPVAWKKKKSILPNLFSTNGMMANYAKVTWRNLRRNKVFSFINIAGLAIGMASAILILLWIQNELSFDEFHTKKDRIYQLYTKAKFDGQLACWGNTPMVMKPVIDMNYPEVEAATRVNWVAAFILKTGDKQIQTEGNLVDPAFLTMFDFPLTQGNRNTALNTTHSIVVTEKLAKKLFGNEEAMGKVIRIDSNVLFTVTAVMKDLPNNTGFRFEYLVPFNYMKEVGWYNENWAPTIVRTYLLVKPGVSEARLNKLFRNIVTAHASDVKNEVFAHPLHKWRLWSHFENGVNTGGYIETVRMFGIIAAFILLIACINYMNLGTARSVQRAKEVGIRKVVGAAKSSLISQFLWESILFAFIAGILALVIVEPSFGWFNKLTNKELFIPYNNPYFWLTALGFILFTGIIAGSYPAFYLSSYKPMSVLKGTFKSVRALVTPRKMLVVVQFTFAIVLIICTVVIYRQIVYAEKRDAGFDMDKLVFVYNKGDLGKNFPAIRDAMLRSGAVTDVTRTSCPITDVWASDDTYDWDGKNKNIRSWCIKSNVEQGFVKTMGLHLLQGRDIDIERYPTDSTAVLLNESAVKEMGFKNPIGQQIKNSQGNWHVVGVIKNYVAGMPYEPFYPMVIHGPTAERWFGTLSFRLNGRNSTSSNLAKIGAIYKQYNPDYPFEYFFADKSYAAKFEYEYRSGKLAALFAGLTIFISCLGLFALAAFMAESRIKEIGVRKVLGASATAITALLSKDFLRLVIISFLIASPLAWWAMHHWLQDYSYRVDISWWVFVITGLLSVLIAFATVSYQAIKAALSSPVKALRSE